MKAPPGREAGDSLNGGCHRRRLAPGAPTDGSSFPITTPNLNFPANTPHGLTLIIEIDSGGAYANGLSLSFPSVGDVFNILSDPTGVTVDSVSGNIVDNQWQGVAGEPPPVPALSRGALLGLAALLGGSGWAMRRRVWLTT